MGKLFEQRASGRMYQNPSTIQNPDVDITATNLPVAVRSDPTYGTYRKYADGTTQGRVLQSSSQTLETGGLGADFTYQSISLTLPLGRWQVFMIISMHTGVAPDAMGASFWDNGAGAEFANTTQVASSTAAAQVMSISNSMILDVTPAMVTKVIKVRAKRNGASQVSVGVPAATALKADNRLIAISLS